MEAQVKLKPRFGMMPTDVFVVFELPTWITYFTLTHYMQNNKVSVVIIWDNWLKNQAISTQNAD